MTNLGKGNSLEGVMFSYDFRKDSSCFNLFLFTFQSDQISSINNCLLFNCNFDSSSYTN